MILGWAALETRLGRSADIALARAGVLALALARHIGVMYVRRDARVPFEKTWAARCLISGGRQWGDREALGA